MAKVWLDLIFILWLFDQVLTIEIACLIRTAHHQTWVPFLNLCLSWWQSFTCSIQNYSCFPSSSCEGVSLGLSFCLLGHQSYHLKAKFSCRFFHLLDCNLDLSCRSLFPAGQAQLSRMHHLDLAMQSCSLGALYHRALCYWASRFVSLICSISCSLSSSLLSLLWICSTCIVQKSWQVFTSAFWGSHLK